MNAAATMESIYAPQLDGVAQKSAAVLTGLTFLVNDIRHADDVIDCLCLLGAAAKDMRNDALGGRPSGRALTAVRDNFCRRRKGSQLRLVLTGAMGVQTGGLL
jgi:hypothetical protein